MADSKLKVTYFDLTAKGEILRLILVAAGKSFEDDRVQFADWAKMKPTTPFGSLPVLEIDGKKYAQTTAIAEYLAREFGFYGKTNLDGLKIGQVALLMEDYFKTFSSFIRETDKDGKAALAKKLKEEVGPWVLGCYEKLLKENGTGHFVGDYFSLADLIVFDQCTGFFGLPLRGLLPKYPLVQKLVARVGEMDRIKAYMATRKRDNHHSGSEALES